MGTPGRTVEESAQAFAAIGLDGTELVCREGAAFCTAVADDEARRLAEFARAAGAPVTALTPYAWDINSPDSDVADAQLAELTRAIELASLMGAEFVRAYGGRESTDDPGGARQRTVRALREAGACAAAKGVLVLVENHPGSATRTGAATRRVIDEVGLACVRALYDPGNVLHDTDEQWQVTFDVQAEVIGYVHVKDYDDRSGKRHACNVGDGVVPWSDILRRLQASGYDGCLSFEYEKMWYPDDLTDAEDGMKRSFEFAKGALSA